MIVMIMILSCFGGVIIIEIIDIIGLQT